MPGVSTRSEAGEVSGRGVGMDVVKTNISKLGGVIDVHSEQGIGTKMTITLPITLAIISALIVYVRRSHFRHSARQRLGGDRASSHRVSGRWTAAR